MLDSILQERGGSPWGRMKKSRLFCKKDLPDRKKSRMFPSCTAEVAQLAEHLVVAQRAESSSLFFRPILHVSP